MKYPGPKSISSQARQFIDSQPPLEPALIAVDTIQAIRDQAVEFYRPAVEHIRTTYKPEIKEISISNVPVQQVCVGTEPSDSDPIILYCFGGGFVTGSPTTDQVITVPLAHQTGATIYAPLYRLAPEHPYPAASDDCLSVYMGLLDQVGANRVSIVGESAGGNLALSVLIRAREAGLPMPRPAALLSPFCDFSLASDTLTTLAGIDPTLGSAESVVETYAVGHDVRTPALSPIFAEFDASFPPTLITTGTRDLLLSESARLSTRMRQSGVDVSLHVWEGMWHVFEFYPHIPEAQQSLDEISKFLRQHFFETAVGATP